MVWRMLNQQLDDLISIARSRRATRHFKQQQLPDGLLDQLLDAARWAPSGYNLQPTHWVVLTKSNGRIPLQKACMGQKQITEAPAVVVFTGDKNVARNHFDAVIENDRRAGAIGSEYELLLRKYVPMAFGTGPLRLGWIAKALGPPLLRYFAPVPNIPAVHRRYWLTKQVTLSAMVFMLAATAAGLATCPMEGFDETRVRRILGIPRSFVPVLVIAVGYASDQNMIKTRLPLNDLIHREQW